MNMFGEEKIFSRNLNIVKETANPSDIAEKRRERLGAIEEKIAKLNSSHDSIELKELEKERKILQYLVENLPEGEERISVLMDKNCQVSIVIPVYGERDFIFRPLESLTIQEGVSAEEFEAIFVVNNPRQIPERNIAKESEADYRRKVEHYHRAVIENQEVLKIISLIGGRESEVDLNPEEKRVIEKIKKLGIKIFAIDKASPGKNLPDREANVGGARNRGVAEAVARFYEQKGENGIIAQTDGDSFMRESYVAAIIKTFNEQQDLVGAAGELRFEDIGEVEFKDGLHELKNLESVYSYVVKLILKRNFSDSFVELSVKNDYKRFHFSGANMISRSHEAALVGGVKKIGGGEDPAFGYALAEIGRVSKIPEIKVLTADRFSSRTDVGCGHGQYNIQLQEAAEKGEVLADSAEGYFIINSILKKFNKAFLEGGLTIESLRKILTFQGECILDNKDLESIILGSENIIEGHKRREVFLNNLELYYEKIKMFIFDKAFPKGEIKEESGRLIKIFLEENPHLRKEYELMLDKAITENMKNIEDKKKNLVTVIEKIFVNRGPLLTAEKAIDILLNQLPFKVPKEELEAKRDVIEKLIQNVNESQSEEESFERFIFENPEAFKTMEDDPVRFLSIKLYMLADAIRNENKNKNI